jgi:hypothetical protein
VGGLEIMASLLKFMTSLLKMVTDFLLMPHKISFPAASEKGKVDRERPELARKKRERSELARKKREVEQHRQDDLDELAHKKRVAEIRRQNELTRTRKVASGEMRVMQLKALDFTTYEQAQIVSEIVRMKNYDGAKQVLSVLRDQQKVEEALVDISKEQAGEYENAIKVMANSRAKGINYEDKDVANKVNAAVESCIEIGIGALANELNIDIGTQSSSMPKSAIRKTKKWED